MDKTGLAIDLVFPAAAAGGSEFLSLKLRVPYPSRVSRGSGFASLKSLLVDWVDPD